MSKIANELYTILDKLFPRLSKKRVLKEVYVNYKGQKLYFDFFIKDLNLYVEVQGQQHTEYVQHFHGDKKGFDRHKKRDNDKIAYVMDSDGKCSLVRFYYNENITEAKVLYKINKALDEGFYE